MYIINIVSSIGLLVSHIFDNTPHKVANQISGSASDTLRPKFPLAYVLEQVEFTHALQGYFTGTGAIVH